MGQIDLPVTFYLPAEDLDRLRELDPDTDWREFTTGEHAWILQTYLRLSRAGRPVGITRNPPRDGIIVFHAKHKRLLARHGTRISRAVLVGVRADNSSPSLADFEVLQNRFFADGHRHHFVPHWPQPGLVPREPSRGQIIRRVAYKGFRRHLHPELADRRWPELLARRGLEWESDAIAFSRTGTDTSGSSWPDFSRVDVVVAIRPPHRRRHTPKPATKLVNAWIAGVPAVLGPEVAYQELRRSDLDYIEARSLDQAVAAVDRLLAEPQLYAAMVANGRERAEDFTIEAITRCWTELLFKRIPGLALEPRVQRMRSLPLGLRALVRRLARVAMLRPPR